MRTKKESTITAYKAFDKDWSCRGFKYEIGKPYVHDGDLKICSSGFHACEAPLDVLNYYSLDSKFAEVELSGVSDEKQDDTKRVGKSITINAALEIAGLIKAQVEWCQKNADGKSVASGDSSTAASSGYYSKAASSGDSSTAASSGNYSTAASSGYSSKAASSGYSSKAASSGDSSTAACDSNGFACVAGICGSVKGNKGSALSLGYRDSKDRNRIAVAYVGEGGIKEDTWYQVNSKGEFQEIK